MVTTQLAIRIAIMGLSFTFWKSLLVIVIFTTSESLVRMQEEGALVTAITYVIGKLKHLY
jgi:hypothetical protein